MIIALCFGSMQANANGSVAFIASTVAPAWQQLLLVSWSPGRINQVEGALESIQTVLGLIQLTQAQHDELRLFAHEIFDPIVQVYSVIRPYTLAPERCGIIPVQRWEDMAYQAHTIAAAIDELFIYIDSDEVATLRSLATRSSELLEEVVEVLKAGGDAEADRRAEHPACCNALTRDYLVEKEVNAW
jgi:hypothetical protein